MYCVIEKERNKKIHLNIPSHQYLLCLHPAITQQRLSISVKNSKSLSEAEKVITTVIEPIADEYQVHHGTANSNYLPKVKITTLLITTFFISLKIYYSVINWVLFTHKSNFVRCVRCQARMECRTGIKTIHSFTFSLGPHVVHPFVTFIFGFNLSFDSS